MTEGSLYSGAWAAIENDVLPDRLRDVRDELTRLVAPEPVVVKLYNESYVAVCSVLAVDLPARGPVGGVDIREREPVALLFHRRDYPNRAPFAWSDRRDFPASRLPHLNPTSSGEPPWLCLHRGSIDDWFAEHSLDDFVERVRTWFRDAARDRLMRDGDFFEHTRLVSPSGFMIFRAAAADERARAAWEETGGASGFEYLALKLSADPVANLGWNGSFAVQIDWFITGSPEDSYRSLISRWNKLAAQMPELHKMTTGIICWSPNGPNGVYFGTVPRTYGDLVAFAGDLGVDLRSVISAYLVAGAHALAGIPVIFGVRRPRPLLGRTSDIEWLGFVVVASDDALDGAGAPKDDAVVLALSHREPLAPSFARDLSGEASDLVTSRAIIGCGALGSKLALHLARSGELPSVLVDQTSLTPHHLVRHGLTARHVGANKASALRDELKEMFGHGGESIAVESLEGSANDLLHDVAKLNAVAVLIDATASQAVLNALVDASTIPSSLWVRRCEVADMGRLGILSIEGTERNPRLDDIQVHIFDHARRDLAVSAWLARHRSETEQLRGPALEEIGLGIGCSSTTMRLRDDIVALHAANFVSALRSAPTAGGIFLVHASLDGLFASSTQRIDVGAVTVVEADGAPGWSARVGARAIRAMQNQFRKGGHAERGGILLGVVHRKRRVIYVTDAIAPSSDSLGTAKLFVRGVRDYPDVLLEAETKTGGMIGYVGEWHTHPKGPSTPSPRDLASVRELARSLRPAGLPAHILILSPEGLTCHVEF